MMIRWIGKNTQGNIRWTEIAYSYRELYFKLIDRDIISIVDGFPDEKYMLDRVGLTYEDYNEEAEEEYEGDFQKWLEEVTMGYELSEEEYRKIIAGEKGNAYYQEFEEVKEA